MSAMSAGSGRTPRRRRPRCSATAPNGLTVLRSVTTRSGSPEARGSAVRSRRPRRRRRDGRSPRCRCGLAHEDRRGRPARGLRDARTGGCGRTARGCGGARGAARVAGARQGVRRHRHREHTAASWRPGLDRAAGASTSGGLTGSKAGRSQPGKVVPRPRMDRGKRLSGSCCSPRARASRPWPRTPPAPARWTCSPAAARRRARRSAAVVLGLLCASCS